MLQAQDQVGEDLEEYVNMIVQMQFITQMKVQVTLINTLTAACTTGGTLKYFTYRRMYYHATKSGTSSKIALKLLPLRLS